MSLTLGYLYADAAGTVPLGTVGTFVLTAIGQDGVLNAIPAGQFSGGDDEVLQVSSFTDVVSRDLELPYVALFQEISSDLWGKKFGVRWFPDVASNSFPVLGQAYGEASYQGPSFSDSGSTFYSSWEFPVAQSSTGLETVNFAVGSFGGFGADLDFESGEVVVISGVADRLVVVPEPSSALLLLPLLALLIGHRVFFRRQKPGSPRRAVTVVAAFLAICALATPCLHAELQWEATTLEHRAQFGEERWNAVFVARNTGDQAVEVLKVASSCACTVANQSKPLVGAGEELKVEVTFEYGNRKGLSRQRVLVKTSDRDKPTELTLEVDLTRGIKIEPPAITWTPEEWKRQDERKVTVSRDPQHPRDMTLKGETGSLEIEAVTTEDSKIVFSVRPALGAKPPLLMKLILVGGHPEILRTAPSVFAMVRDAP